jgi:alginate O-acetyltransferase complex protein AlgI
LLPQIRTARKADYQQIVLGLYLIAWGLFKKVIIADGCSHIVTAVFDNDTAFSGLDKLVAIYAFAFQIYGDFSGYSDMARGLAKLMGIELMLNFNLPYFAVSPTDFWARWHISLSTWLRDYLYVPLGGNRRGRIRTCSNLFLTMLLGGLWHGASLTMVVWGAYHGVVLVAYRVLAGPKRGASSSRLSSLRMIAMFHVTCLGWLIFRAQSLGQVGRFLRDIFTDIRTSSYSESYVTMLAQLGLPLVIFEVWQFSRGGEMALIKASNGRKVFIVWAGATVAMAFLILHRTLLRAEVPFVYFQF